MTNRSDLLNLPAELLSIIYRHLPLSGALALTHTCTYLYYSDIAVKSVHQALDLSNPEEEFHARCVLEDAYLITGYHCQGCKKRHPLHEFSYEELSKQASERYCLRTKVCFRLTPFGYKVSFNDVVEAKQRLRYDLFRSGVEFRARNIALWLPVCPVKYARTNSAFRALCEGFNIPLCPHMRLNDEKIMTLFPPRHFFLVAPSYPIPDTNAKCEFCKTKVRLFYEEHDPAEVWLYLEVLRYTGYLQSPRDPLWIAQTYADEDPLLDDYCRAAQKWIDDGCIPWKKPVHLEPKGGSFFTQSTLPPEPPEVIA